MFFYSILMFDFPSAIALIFKSDNFQPTLSGADACLGLKQPPISLVDLAGH